MRDASTSHVDACRVGDHGTWTPVTSVEFTAVASANRFGNFARDKCSPPSGESPFVVKSVSVSKEPACSTDRTRPKPECFGVVVDPPMNALC